MNIPDKRLDELSRTDSLVKHPFAVSNVTVLLSARPTICLDIYVGARTRPE
jgi:hypothetical protein